MAEQFHYPADFLELLIKTIPRLVKSKKSVILFLQGAGVDIQDLAGVNATLLTSPGSITKYEIVRRVLPILYMRGDSGLGPRRGVIRRVVEFEDFESCWEDDRLEAKGLVASVREAVNKNDAFTRMQQEREAERDRGQAARREAQQRAAVWPRPEHHQGQAAIDTIALAFHHEHMRNNESNAGKKVHAVLA